MEYNCETIYKYSEMKTHTHTRAQAHAHLHSYERLTDVIHPEIAACTNKTIRSNKITPLISKSQIASVVCRVTQQTNVTIH